MRGKKVGEGMETTKRETMMNKVQRDQKIEEHFSVIGHGSAGGMSRKTYSKKCTGSERTIGCLEPR